MSVEELDSTPDAAAPWVATNFPPLEELWSAIKGRFGILPAFFKLASPEPAAAWMLFRMAEFAYQDNPLPSLFKEQLFTYLSRFCEVRYCIGRHAAFLLGSGYVAGDPAVSPLRVEDVLALLLEPLPSEREIPALLLTLERMGPLMEGEWPEFGSELGKLIRVGCAVAFLQPGRAKDWLLALRKVVGIKRYEQLMLLIAFIRMAHFWTHLHPDLAFEGDLSQLLRDNLALVQPIMETSEAAHWAVNIASFDELRFIRESKVDAYLAAIVESSDDAIVSKDLDGTVRSWNPGAERMFGYEAEDIIGRSIRMIIPPDRQAEEDEVLRRINLGERVDHFETQRMRKNGDLVDISLCVSPIRDATGTVVGASKIARDITERKKLERAEKEASEVKGQFLALVSHELRTPIATILANALVLVRRGELLQPQDRQQSLVDIAGEAEKLRDIVENLLLLTRLEASNELNVEAVGIADVLNEQIDVLRHRRPQRDVQVRYLESESVRVMGQRQLIAMVLANLLGNADKYSPLSLPIEVSIWRAQEGLVRFAVRDHGIGIEAEELPNLFSPFYRSETAKAYAPGMGLGLAVCKRIIETLGGRIWTRQPAEDGSEFIFTLPVAPITGRT